MADLYLKTLESERRALWAECRQKGLARGTPQRLRLVELDRLLAEHRAEPAGWADAIEASVLPPGVSSLGRYMIQLQGLKKQAVNLSRSG